MRRTKILLADSRDVAHLGFRQLLGNEPWVARLLAATSPDRTLALTRDALPDIVVIGADMTAHHATQLCSSVREESAATRVLIVTAEPISRRRARAAGADGTVPASWHGREIVGAVRTVALGMNLFAAETEPANALLTSRELQVLELIGSGATNREIAESLALSTNTVKDHTTTLYRKIKARNRADAIVRARDLGLLA